MTATTKKNQPIDRMTVPPPQLLLLSKRDPAWQVGKPTARCERKTFVPTGRMPPMALLVRTPRFLLRRRVHRQEGNHIVECVPRGRRRSSGRFAFAPRGQCVEMVDDLECILGADE